MSDVGDKRDVTVDLPEEVLCHVFSFLPLKDKLQSEAVNHKFQRCVVKELEAKPQPLKLDLLDKKLNGYSMRKKEGDWKERMFGGIQTLAKKAKFSGIWVHFGHGSGTKCVEKLDGILSLLISEKQCLTKMTAFRTDSGCSQAVMENFLDNCAKLSNIKYNFFIRPLDNEPIGNSDIFPLDLAPLFKNKSLVELELRFSRYHQEGLVEIFRGIHLNALRKLDLLFLESTRGLNVAELFTAMRTNASALEEINLDFYSIRVQWADLFESLAQLPALRTCEIICFAIKLGDQQFVAGATALFRMSDIDITIIWDDDGNNYGVRGCQMVNVIRQIQSAHQGLMVDFVPSDHRRTSAEQMILSVGKATLQKKFYGLIEHCGAEDCIQCQSFYPSLLDFLRSQARRVTEVDFVEAQHLPSCFLDRCRIGQLLDDLKVTIPRSRCRPLSIESNEDQQSVTIYFEIVRAVEHRLFSITVSCGRCLTNDCMKCMN